MSNTVYDFPLKTIKGEPFNLGQYKGKKLLLVNTASQCGLTPQYKQLQELQEHFKDKLVIVGLPCNDFGEQEPDPEDKVAQFCEVNYGVTFPLTSKVNILGPNPHPLYNFLMKKDLNGYRDSEVKWNFQKYLINEEGSLVKVFAAPTEPLSEEVIKEIEK